MRRPVAFQFPELVPPVGVGTDHAGTVIRQILKQMRTVEAALGRGFVEFPNSNENKLRLAALAFLSVA